MGVTAGRAVSGLRFVWSSPAAADHSPGIVVGSSTPVRPPLFHPTFSLLRRQGCGTLTGMNEMPPIPHLLPQPAPRRTGWVVYALIVSFFFALSVVINLGLLAKLTLLDGFSARDTHRSHLQERFVSGDEDAHDKIVEIDLTGVIGFDGDESGNGSGMVADLKDQLDQAVQDKQVKAIVLRINSPGGEVVASDAIYRALAEVRSDTNRAIKIISCIETVGASGAFYAAMGTDYIVANELSITASIGVIMETFNFGPFEDKESLMHKLGVRSYVFKSGKLKDILNPTRAPTEEETKLVNNLIMEVYDKFVGIVANERDLDVTELKNGIADGRIVSGKQALEAKLVDELGYFEDAIDAAKEKAGIDKAKVVQYSQPFSLRHFLQLFGQSHATKLQIQIAPNPLKMQAGQMYFLPAYMFQ